MSQGAKPMKKFAAVLARGIAVIGLALPASAQQKLRIGTEAAY